MLAERGLPDEPLFCFETALKMSYFCMHIYRHFNVSCWCYRGAVCKGLLCSGCRVVGCSEWRTCNWVNRLGRFVRSLLVQALVPMCSLVSAAAKHSIVAADCHGAV